MLVCMCPTRWGSGAWEVIVAVWTDDMRRADAALRDAVASGDHAAMFAAARVWDAAVARMFAESVCA